MKKILLFMGFALVLFAGCRQQIDEPELKQPAEETVDLSFLYTDNDPFWGPQENYFEGLSYDNKIPGTSLWSGITTLINLGVSLGGWVMLGLDKRSDSPGADVEKLNTTISDLSNQANSLSKQIVKDITKLSDRMGKQIQVLIAQLTVSQQIALAHNTVDRLNDLTDYINTANERRDALLGITTNYYQLVEKINNKYGIIPANDDKKSLEYYKEIYLLLDEWAQPDYSMVVESVCFPHFLASQSGKGMPVVYKNFAKGCCAWNNEALQLQSYMNFLDMMTVMEAGRLANLYLSACSYLHIGPDPVVCSTWQQELFLNFEEYRSLIDSVKPCKEVECYIPNAHFKADTLLTEIDFQHFPWMKNLSWSIEKFVYGGLPQGVTQTSLLTDSMAANIMAYYKGSSCTLCQHLVEDAGFRMPKGANYSPDQCAILFNGKCKTENTTEGTTNVYCAAGYLPLYYGGIGVPFLMGTLNNDQRSWKTFEQPNIWLFAKLKK